MQPGRRLVGKVAIVTGAASGIGAETSRLFAEHGAAVLLTDVSAAAGDAVAKQISEAGGTAVFAEQDVRNEGRWTEIISLAVRAFGQPNILFNYAGHSLPDPH